MNRHHISALALVLALALFAPLVATRAQDSSAGTAALAGKDVIVAQTGGDFRMHIDSVEPAGFWTSKVEPVLATGTKLLPTDVNEFRYFIPWGSIISMRVKK
jgi:hypothetical protein